MRRVLLAPGLVLSIVAAAPAQDAPPPAFDWISILNMPFYPASGGLMVRDLQLLLLPAGTTTGQLLVQRGAEVLLRDPLAIQTTEYPAVFVLSRTNPGGLTLAQAGDLTMAFQVGDRTITEVPLTLTQVAGGDAYNPTRTWVRDGPWRTLAFIAVPTDQPTTALRVCWWSSIREFASRAPGGVTARIRRGTTEVGRTRGPLHVSDNDWQHRCADLSVPPAERTLLNMAGLTDGSYTLALEADGGVVVKRFPFTVRGGQIAPHARSAVDYSPSTAHLPPRAILRSGNRHALFTISWLEATR